MPFDKDNTQSKGRPKGSQNKDLAEARKLLLNVISNEAENIEQAFKDLREEDAYKYLSVLSKFTSYLLPRPTDTKDNHVISLIGPPFNIKDIFKVEGPPSN